MSQQRDGTQPAPFVTLDQARTFLADQFGVVPGAVELVGEGAWSRCFGFPLEDDDLVVRFGRHVDDFHKDQRAMVYATAGLPIPRVFDVGRAFDGYYAISTRAYGIPLETVAAAVWTAVVPSVVDALEALRTADLSSTSDWGGWDADGRAACASWSEHLLAMGVDHPDQRTHGWRSRLASHAAGEAAFVQGYALLQEVVSDEVPRCLLHCDLMNRNVLVDEGRLTAVFDWGCGRYGDHLYDLAWFEFWAPWHPELDVDLLKVALAERWSAIGYAPSNLARRMLACHLHIGLDHLGYNAYLGDWSTLMATAARMQTLVEVYRT